MIVILTEKAIHQKNRVHIWFFFFFKLWFLFAIPLAIVIIRKYPTRLKHFIGILLNKAQYLALNSYVSKNRPQEYEIFYPPKIQFNFKMLELYI